MPRDSDLRSRSHPAHSPFVANRKPPPLIPSLVVGAVFLFALLFLTVPNWGEFSRSVSQFPALWQVSSNRREIIFLVIRVCSPLLLAAIAGACCWLGYTIKAYLRKEEPPEQVQPRGPMLPSSPVGQRKASTSSTQEPGQRGAPSLPSTPIPPVLSNASEDQDSLQHTWQEAEGEEEHPDLGESTQEKSPYGKSSGYAIAPTSAPEDLEILMEEMVPGADATHPPLYVTITVLKELSLMLHVPGGKSYRVPLHLNA